MSDPWPWPLRLYGRLASAAAPLARPLLAWRARRGKEDPSRLAERLGHSERARDGGPLVWLHGVSIGESLALLPVMDDLGEHRPGLTFLVTTGTTTAAELLATRLPGNAIHQYAPIDTPQAVGRFFARWRPDLGVLVESELWPNLIREARRSGVPLALVSAKISAVSARSWRRSPRAARALLRAFDLVLARDETAAATLGELGAKVDGLWDAKFGAAPLPVDRVELERLRQALAGSPVLLAASTHLGEEAMALEAFLPALANLPNARLVLAPRHPARGEQVAKLAAAFGLPVARRSDGADLPSTTVLIADTLGEMGLWYRLSALAMVGGSLVPGTGGHNPLEPARLGCPFVAGVHVDAWPIYRDLAAAGATRLVRDRAELADIIGQATLGAAAVSEMARRALAFVEPRDAQNRTLAPRLLALMSR